MLLTTLTRRAVPAGLATRVYCGGLALLMVLSEVFSSSIQATLPGFSHAARLALTGGAVLLLGAKCLLLTDYTARWQPAVVAVTLCYTGFAAIYSDDIWFFLAALIGLGVYGVDLKTVLRVYLITAVAGLIVVQLLHYATPLIPYKFYCRNWDFGYGHYNGYGARLIGVFFAWSWLRYDRMRLFDWLGLAALTAYTHLAPGSRGAVIAMLLLLGLLALQKLLPRLFDNEIFYALVLALPAVLVGFALYAGYVYDPQWPYERMALLLLSLLFSGRFEIWHNMFWTAKLTFLGGLPTDGDEHHAIDNAFLALPMNKGYLGAALVALVLLLLLWHLITARRTTELLCLTALLCYLFMENKPFMISANPFLLLLPCALLSTPPGTESS